MAPYVVYLSPAQAADEVAVPIGSAHLCKKGIIINPDPINAILLGVKVANFLTIYISGDTGVPCVGILIISVTHQHLNRVACCASLSSCNLFGDPLD